MRVIPASLIAHRAKTLGIAPEDLARAAVADVLSSPSEDFQARAEETGLGGVVAELLRQKTPSGGFHLVWQCAGPQIRNVKLASKANNEALIETRGDGGYFLISPSQIGRAHV